VLLDGYDLRALSLESVRGNIAALLQETLLFDASVRDNIAFARKGASAAEVEDAARAAGAHEFIAALPEGYDTRVGQRGRRLSGGQRRRIEIARTLLRDAPVVVLDEPTAGLDAEAAERLVQPLRTLLAGRSALMISHDPRLLKCADRVLRLDDARLAERPTVRA
jgi:ATP-binding cassette, subfamily B, bacterial